MDHMCTISFHMYSFPASPRAIRLLYTDRSQAMLTWLSPLLDCVLPDILFQKKHKREYSPIPTLHKAAGEFISHVSFCPPCDYTSFKWINQYAAPVKHNRAAGTVLSYTNVSSYLLYEGFNKQTFNTASSNWTTSSLTESAEHHFLLLAQLW